MALIGLIFITYSVYFHSIFMVQSIREIFAEEVVIEFQTGIIMGVFVG